MDSVPNCLFSHTEIRQPKWGKYLVRLFELAAENQVFFFQNHPFHLDGRMEDHVWIQNLAYLSDIYFNINYLNLPLLGLTVTIFNAQDRDESVITNFGSGKDV
jgi:hypothetical protein